MRDRGELRAWAAIAAVGFMLSSQPVHACAGDCDGDGVVGVAELVSAVSISLGTSALESCPAADTGGDGEVSVDEIVGAVGRALAGCAGQTHAFVLTTNFSAGSFATIELDAPRGVSPSSSQRRLHRDAVVRTRGDLLYVLNRLYADNLQVLDPHDGFRTRLQCSTGNGSNPQDIAFVSDDKAYVTRLEDRSLLVVNPQAGGDCSDFVRGSVDLSSLADADGVPDMTQMAVVGNRLFVSLQRLDVRSALRLPAENGVLAVVDIAADSLVGSIPLSGANPFAATKGLTVHDGKILVAEAGLFGVRDGGIEKVDPATGRAEGFFVTESDLGGDITDFVVVSSELAYAIVSTPGFRTALLAFDPRTGRRGATIAETDGYTFFDLELNDRGELYLADRDRRHDGVRVYRARDGVPLVEAPMDLGLSPFEIVFFR